jgi:uncharacterized protein (DUF697 family)
MSTTANGSMGSVSGSGGSSAEITAGAEQEVKRHMLIALAVGLVPVPLFDVAALTAIQLRLLSRLSSLYRVEFSEQLGKSLIGSLLGAGGSLVGSTAAYRLLLRLIPVGGWVVSAATGSVFAGASTYAVGKVFIQHFGSGGTFLTFDPDKVRQYYAQQFQQGAVEVRATFAGIQP